MAIAQNIEIDQSSDYLKQFIAKDDTGTVIDLTGSTVTSQVRKSYGTTTIAATFTATVTPAVTTGEYTLALTDVQTAAMERGRHVYDVVQEITATGFKPRIMEGIAVVSPSVTRPAP